MLAAEFVVNYSYRNVVIDAYQHHPEKFWDWYLPYNIAIKLAFLVLIFVRGRRVNIATLVAMILLFLVPYWRR